MGLFDYIILGIIAACVVGAVVYMRHRHKNGKSISCGGCDGCCERCRQKNAECDKKNNTNK